MFIIKILLILTGVGRTLGDLPTTSGPIYLQDTEQGDLNSPILEPFFRQDAEGGNLNPRNFEPIYNRDAEQVNPKSPILETIYRQDARDFSAFISDHHFRQEAVKGVFRAPILEPILIYRQRRDTVQLDLTDPISEPIYRRDAEHRDFKAPGRDDVDTEVKDITLETKQSNVQHETSPYEDAKNAVKFHTREKSLPRQLRQLTSRTKYTAPARRRTDYDADINDYVSLRNQYPTNHRTHVHSQHKHRSRLNEPRYGKDEIYPKHLSLYTKPHRESHYNKPSNNKLYNRKLPILSLQKENLLNIYNGDPLQKSDYSTPKLNSLHDKVAPDYNYKYSVNDPASGNKFGHGERRTGNRVEGSYYVHLPGGSYQRVKYFA